MLVLAFVALPETLPVERRRPVSIVGSLRAYGQLFGDRLFIVMVLVAGLMFATLFAYISGAPFVLQDLYGMTPQQFGLAFSANAVGMIAMTQINPWLVKRYSPVSVLTFGVLLAVSGAIALLRPDGCSGVGGWFAFMAPLFFVISAAGLSFPNAPAIALSRHGESAGTAAAMLGASQFMIGGADRSAGRRVRQRHAGADGRDHGRHHRPGRRPAAQCPQGSEQLRLPLTPGLLGIGCR